MQRAQDLDHIIAAHDVFLDTIISRCLLDNNSRVSFSLDKLTEEIQDLQFSDLMPLSLVSFKPAKGNI